MIHDEETTEIEIPGLKSNIVRVNFAQKSVPTPPGHFIPSNQPVPVITRRTDWLHRMDTTAPWVLRFVAALLVLALSLLIF